MKEIRICGVCESKFEDYISNKRSGFCSLPCYWKSKKGETGHWLGKKRRNMEGKNNPKWLGEKVKYHSLHTWVKRHRSKTEVCEICRQRKKTDWANKSHEYKRSLSDWLELCRKCHIKFDKNFRGVGQQIYGKNYRHSKFQWGARTF